MRIVLDGRILLPRMTGAGRYVLELARRLPRARPTLELVVLLTPTFEATDIPRALEEAGVTVEYVSARVASGRQWIVIPSVLRRLKPDLYHYPFLDLPYVHYPCVITVYDLNPLLDPDYFGRNRRLKRWAAWRLLDSSVRRSRAVLAISLATRTLLEHHLPRSRGKVAVVPLGVDAYQWGEPLDGPGSAESARSGPWSDRPYFLYVGVDRPHKNLLNLVLGFDTFRRANGWAEGRGPYLLLAGVGDGSPRLREVMGATGSANDIRLGPPLAEVELRRVYRDATALVYVSRSEGFGLPILESFAAGTPVIAGDQSSLPEVGGDAVEYCCPSDPHSIARALQRVWHDDALRRALVQKGLQRVREFSWDRTARDTLAIYEAALGIVSNAASSQESRHSLGAPPD